MVFNKQRSGQIVQLVNGEVYYINSDGRYAYTGVEDTGTIVTVTLTGWSVISDKGKTLYQTAGGGYIDLNDGWTPRGFSTSYSTRSAQSYVNEVIKNNKIILQNNLFCARFASRLTSQQRTLLKGLQERLQERNKSLLNDGLVTVRETSYPQGYADLAPSLEAILHSTSGVNGAVGVVVSTTVVIVISAIVIASLSTAAYFAYRAMAAESRDDVQFSKELTATLTSKLSAEEWEQLRSETQGIVTKARIKQSLSDLGTVGKVLIGLAAGFGAYAIYKKFIKRQ